MQAPRPAILVQQFGERTIDVRISFWVHDLAEAGTIRSQVMISIHYILFEAGMQLYVQMSSVVE